MGRKKILSMEINELVDKYPSLWGTWVEEKNEFEIEFPLMSVIAKVEEVDGSYNLTISTKSDSDYVVIQPVHFVFPTLGRVVEEVAKYGDAVTHIDIEIRKLHMLARGE